MYSLTEKGLLLAGSSIGIFLYSTLDVILVHIRSTKHIDEVLRLDQVLAHIEESLLLLWAACVVRRSRVHGSTLEGHKFIKNRVELLLQVLLSIFLVEHVDLELSDGSFKSSLHEEHRLGLNSFTEALAVGSTSGNVSGPLLLNSLCLPLDLLGL